MNRNKLFFVVLGMSIVSMAGCELIVDFDRTKIDGGALDGTTQDVTNDVVVDQGNKDVSNDVVNDVTTTDASDGGTTDTGTDASDGSTADADDGSADAPAE